MSKFYYSEYKNTYFLKYLLMSFVLHAIKGYLPELNIRLKYRCKDSIDYFYNIFIKILFPFLLLIY